MVYGKNKYGLWNHRKGIAHRRLIDACIRHLLAHLDGENLDPESLLPHVHHAAASLNMLCANMAEHPELDDRYEIMTKKQAEKIINWEG